MLKLLSRRAKGLLPGIWGVTPFGASWEVTAGVVGKSFLRKEVRIDLLDFIRVGR